MGGSTKAPKPSDQSEKNERLSEKLMQQQLDQAKKPLEFPNITAPKALSQAPLPTASASADVAAAEEEARRAAGRRTNTARKTLFAGETGGWKPPAMKKTLLGGQPATVG